MEHMVAFLQGNEMIWVLVAVVLLFGGTQIPKLARSLGQAQKEFKDGLKDGATEDSDTSETQPEAKPETKS